MANAGLASDLRRLVGRDGVSTDAAHLERYGGDALGVFRAFRAGPRLESRPAAVVWPADTAEVSEILRFAQLNHVPVVPYGGGTGVMGAATAGEGSIVLSLGRLNAVLKVSERDMAARLQAGVLLEDAASAVEGAGLVFGHDPWSRPIATVGGAISTDGVGYTAASHGSMGDQVLGLTAVLPDGEVVRARDVPKSSYGPSLNHLLIGSEGTLGVVTEAAVQAFSRPEARILRAYLFPDFESGFEAVSELYRQGVRPTMVDYGEEPWPPGSTPNDEATLYLAFEGFQEDADSQDRRARQVCLSSGGRDGDAEEVRRFWGTRHATGDRYRREVLDSPSPGKARRTRSAYRMDYLHVALPVSRVLEYRRKCRDILSSNRVIVREWSLWARPEFLSFLISEEDDQGGDTSPSMAETVDSVLTLAQEMGGTMEYCHGVGIKLAHLVDGDADGGLALAKRIKKALDPGNILNPGKLLG